MNAERTPRTKNQRGALLDLLADGRWHETNEMARVGGIRFSARLLELREQGYTVEKKHIFAGIHSYRWKQHPGQMKLL